MVNERKPRKLASENLSRRVQNEMESADPETVGRFKEEHGGLSPIELALSMLPTEDRERIAKTHPHMIKKPRARR
jgi:hypothetical protein